MALAVGVPLVKDILSILEDYPEYHNMKKVLALDSKTCCLLLTQDPTKYKSTVSNVINHVQSLWTIDEIHYLPGTEMDKLADIGTHKWKAPEDSWSGLKQGESYFTGMIFNSPRHKWPIVCVTTFMHQEKKALHKLPFLREDVINVTDSNHGITVSF